MSRYFILAFSALCLSGCLENKQCQDMEFGRLIQTDRVVITDNVNREIVTITDREKLAEIASFALSHRAGWETPWAGTPVALVQANFYVGGRFIGDVGVGSNFLTAQGCGFFQSRKLGAKDRETIMAILAVKDPYADK